MDFNNLILRDDMRYLFLFYVQKIGDLFASGAGAKMSLTDLTRMTTSMMVMQSAVSTVSNCPIHSSVEFLLGRGDWFCFLHRRYRQSQEGATMIHQIQTWARALRPRGPKSTSTNASPFQVEQYCRLTTADAFLFVFVLFASSASHITHVISSL